MNNYPKDLDIGESLRATSASMQTSNASMPVMQIPSELPQITSAKEVSKEKAVLADAQYLSPRKVTVRRYVLKK